MTRSEIRGGAIAEMFIPTERFFGRNKNGVRANFTGRKVCKKA